MRNGNKIISLFLIVVVLLTAGLIYWGVDRAQGYELQVKNGRAIIVSSVEMEIFSKEMRLISQDGEEILIKRGYEKHSRSKARRRLSSGKTVYIVSDGVIADGYFLKHKYKFTKGV